VVERHTRKDVGDACDQGECCGLGRVVRRCRRARQACEGGSLPDVCAARAQTAEQLAQTGARIW
jgi:hypothetical protein